jgi:hypothetical protein
MKAYVELLFFLGPGTKQVTVGYRVPKMYPNQEDPILKGFD